MSDHILLYLLKERVGEGGGGGVGGGVAGGGGSILSISSNEFIKFNSMTLKSHLIRDFRIKTSP